MFKTLQASPRQVPDPTEPTYYWFRRTPAEPWKPVLVTPAERGWPATAAIGGDPFNKPDVQSLEGEWRVCPLPVD